MLFLLTHAPIRNWYTSLLEEKPLSARTLQELQDYHPHLETYSQQYHIPIQAVAAAVGSEINRRIYVNRMIDIVQDYLFTTRFCSNDFLEWSLQTEFDNRYFNFTKQDLGLGNVQLGTAWQMREEYPQEFEGVENLRDMADYLLTTEGNIHVASVIIKHANDLFQPHYGELAEAEQSAVLFSYYKQGQSYYDRYASQSNFHRPPIPGGGQDIIEKLNATIYRGR